MAQKTAWGTPTNLNNYLLGAGVAQSTLDALDLQGALDDATAELQRITNYTPFLADAEDVTRYFDPPGNDGPTASGWRGGERKLYFEAGLVSLTSLTISGVEKVQGTDFWLRPSNAPVKNEPYTYVEFLLPVWDNAEAIAITGKWGFSDVIPDNVWKKHIEYAAYTLKPQLSLKISRGVVQVKDENTTVTFSSGALSPVQAEANQWLDDWYRTLSRVTLHLVF